MTMCVKQFRHHIPFIYLFPTDLWENTWHLALSIHPSAACQTSKDLCVACVCVCWVEWAKWLSNYVRVWDNSVGFSLHSWLFFDCQHWHGAKKTTHTYTHTLLFFTFTVIQNPFLSPICHDFPAISISHCPFISFSLLSLSHQRFPLVALFMTVLYTRTQPKPLNTHSRTL